MEAPPRQRVLHGGASPQAPEDGGAERGAEQLPGSTSFVTTPAAAGEARGGAAVSTAATHSTTAADTAAPGDAASTTIAAYHTRFIRT
jgi:hypothetical protein